MMMNHLLNHCTPGKCTPVVESQKGVLGYPPKDKGRGMDHQVRMVDDKQRNMQVTESHVLEHLFFMMAEALASIHASSL